MSIKNTTAFVVEPKRSELLAEIAYRQAKRSGAKKLPARPVVTGDAQAVNAFGGTLAKLTNAQLQARVGEEFTVTEWDNRKGAHVTLRCLVKRG